MKAQSVRERQKTKRVQFEFTEQGIEELRKLMEVTNVATRKDLFNNAITLLEWAVKERGRGKIIASIDEENGRYKELEMPVLLEAWRGRGKKNNKEVKFALT